MLIEHGFVTAAKIHIFPNNSRGWFLENTNCHEFATNFQYSFLLQRSVSGRGPRQSSFVQMGCLFFIRHQSLAAYLAGTVSALAHQTDSKIKKQKLLFPIVFSFSLLFSFAQPTPALSIRVCRF